MRRRHVRVVSLIAVATLLLSGPIGCDEGTQLAGELVLVERQVRDLKVLSIRPEAGPVTGGTLVVLTGEGFEPNMVVTFDEGIATQIFVGGDELAAMLTPAGASPATVDVVVTRPSDGKSATIAGGFTYLPPPEELLVTEVIPGDGPLSGGNTVTVAGQGFTAGAKVHFGEREASGVRTLGPDAIIATAPAGANLGNVPVRVELPDGQSHSLTQGYVYLPEDPASKLRVLGVIPSQGPLQGGNVVTIEGAGFVDGVEVRIGGKLATDVRVLGLNAITCTAPPGSSPGFVEVRVDIADPDDESVTPTSSFLSDAYRYLPEDTESLTVLNVIPGEGPLNGGNLVAVRGTGFEDGAKLYFDGAPATQVQFLGANALTGRVPASAVAGPVDVRVENPATATGGAGEAATLASGYTYQPGEPDLLVLRTIPGEGPTAGGNVVAVEGVGFRAGAAVHFGGAEATEVQVLGPTALTVRAPARANPGPVSVRVDLSGLPGVTGVDAYTLQNGYNYALGGVVGDFNAASLYPTEGDIGGGSLVLITGAGFDPAMVVRFGQSQSPITQVLSSSAATALVPAGSPGLVDVTLVNPSAQITLPNGFRYVTEDSVVIGEPPALGAITPARGPTSGGTIVRVVGQNFAPELRVFFGEHEATDVRVASTTEAAAVVPAGASGAVSVRVLNPDDRDDVLNNAFVYADPADGGPAVSALWPNTGPSVGGTWVSVDGERFEVGTVVWFGMRPAASTRHVSGERLVAVAPPAAVGSVDVTVVRADGAWVAAPSAFAYYDIATLPADPPVVSSVFPGLGSTAGGDQVAIIGNDFDPAARFYFDHLEAQVVDPSSPSQRVALTPARPAGSVAVTAVNPNGLTSTRAGAFVYYAPPPIVITVDPGVAAASGGAEVTIRGKNFVTGTIVELGDMTITSFNERTAERLRFFAPAHPPATLSVATVNPDGQRDVMPNALMYVADDQFGAPVVTGVEPTHGLATGGYLTIIRGGNFQPGATVTFGGAPATNVQLLAEDTITAYVPAGTAGATVDVTVANSAENKGTLTGAFTYTAAPVGSIAVRSVAPGTGSIDGGTVITINGEGFETGSTVLVGGLESPAVAVISPTVLTAITPAAQSPGLVDVQVRRPDLASATAFNAFGYFDPATMGQEPTIFNVDPVIGPLGGGTAVMVTGQRFAPPVIVFFGGREALSATVLDSGRILARAPAATMAGTVAVAVINGDGLVGVLPGGFSYYDAAGILGPVIGGLLPSEGSVFGGTTVTVVGQRLSAATRIYLCDRPAQIVAAQASNVEIRTPPGAPGPCSVTAVNSDGLTHDLHDAFNYVSPNPVVTDVIPQIGPIGGGIDVVVRGDNFVPGASVRFGNTLSPHVVVADAGTLTATLPPATLGAVDVTVVNPGGKTGTLTGGFTYVDSVSGVPPTITAIVPSSGPLAGGTPVQVLGENFDVGALLLFSQAAVTDRIWISPTEMRFVTPAGGAAGPVPITVLNPDGLGATVPAGFTYATPQTPAPTISSVVPSSGREAGGTQITITGSNFHAQGTWRLGSKPLDNVATVSSSLVTARTPAGSPGPVDLVYVGPDGQVALRLQAFTYLAAPVLTAITPSLGNVAGGTEVTLIGDHFESGMQVFFGNMQGQILSVQSAVTALARTPASLASGFVDVRVRNPDGQEAVRHDGFEFLDAPSLAGVWPPSGPSSGGTLTWIEGDGFHPQSQVFFGTAQSPEVHFQSRHLLFAFAPGGAVGAVNVRVLNPDQRDAELSAAYAYSDPGTLGSSPFIGEMFPARGPTLGGTHVSLDGAAFQPDARVVFLPQPADLEFLSATRAIAIAPPNAPGPSRVYITNPDGQTIEALEAYTYLDPSVLGTPPVIGNVNPTRGPTAGGTSVTLIGNHFQAGARVRFGAWDGQVTSTTAQQVVALTPPSAAGSRAIRVVNPDGTQALAPAPYLFMPPPNILAVNPNRSPASGGVSVTISGTDLRTDPDGLLPDVYFCTNYAQGTDCALADPNTVGSNSGGTQLTLIAPPHTPALVDVAVVAPDGQFHVAGAAFTYSALPTIVSIEPDNGPTAGGRPVTIRGTNFQLGAFVRIGNELCTDLQVQDATTIHCTSPTGPTGPASVLVTNPDTGSVTAAGGFTFIPPPTITNMVPSVGPQNADDPIVATITGFNFRPGLEVFIGVTKVPDADVTVNGTTSITLRVPTQGAGSNDVRVVNPDGQFAVLLDGFTYIPPLPPPSITFITPTTGITLGGDEIRIAGQNFLQGVRVFLGKEGDWLEATHVDVRNNNTLIVALTPSSPAGLVDVFIQNTDGQADARTDAFEFIPPAGSAELKFFSIEPTRSILAGGGRFTISGEGFRAGVSVRFVRDEANVTFASNVVRLGPTLLTGTLPPAPGGVPGKVTVRIVNPIVDGTPDIIEGQDAFEYVDGPVFVRDPGDRLPNEPANDRGVLIFDANGDGLNDVLVYTTTVDRLLINGYEGRSGHFQAFDFAPETGNFNTAFAVAGDFDQDGDIDIIRHAANATLQFCPNDGGGNFPRCFPLQSYSCNMRRFVAADLNCDGKLDLFLPFNSTSSNCQNRLLIGRGDGTFIEAPAGTLPPLLENTMGVAAADVDLDNDIDLLLANDNSVQTRLYLNNCSDIQATGTCEPGIPHFDNVSFDGRSYAFSPPSGTTNVPATANWEDARAYCQSFGYDLVTISSAAEDDFVRSTQGNAHFWIGYSAPENVGNDPSQYTWVQDEFSSFTNWCSGAPSGTTNCAYYQFSTNPASNCWWNAGCTGGRRFVCESPRPLCESGWRFEDVQYGTLESGRTFPVAATNARDALLVDINDDGLPDAIIASWGQQVNVFMNVGGRFAANDNLRWPINEPNPFIDRLIAADIDGDGDLDIIAQAANHEVRVYVNQLKEASFATFADETPVRWPSGDGFDSRTDVTDFGVGDLDGDLLPDLYLVGATYTDRIVLNRGYDEGLPWIAESRVPIGHFRFNTFRRVPERFYDGRGIKLGDLDGVNGPDLVKCGMQERLTIYFNDGAGKFVDVTDQVLDEDYYFWCGHGQAIELIDLDGDGDLDIVYEGAVHGWSNCAPQTSPCTGRVQLINRLNETGKFHDVAEVNMPHSRHDWAVSVLFADFDNDGDMDMFVGSYSSTQSRMYINGGDVWNVGGTYFFNVPSMLSDPATGSTITLNNVYDAAIVDLNGDAYPDLFLGTGGQNVVLLNEGGVGFRNVTLQYASTTADSTRRLLVADFDNDGDDDIVVINQSQANRFLLRQAADYSNVTESSFSEQISDNSRSGAMGDLDLDESFLIDFVVANYNQQNRLWINQGSGQFLHLTDNLPWDTWRTYDVILFDIDGDGDLDIYWVNEDQDRIYINTIIP